MSEQVEKSAESPASSDAGKRSISVADVVGLLVVAIAGVCMACYTWLGWPDPVIDFGRELYTPWQITEGKHLYRDMALFNGPISQYFNALMFAVFGVGLRTVVWTNLVILAATVGLAYRMIRDVASPIAATVGALSFVLLFAFNQFTPFGNFNWICPYSHELTHGVALSLLAVFIAGKWVGKPTIKLSIAMGIVTGLVFLAKVEVFVACLGAVGLAALTPVVTRRLTVRKWFAQAGMFFVAFLSIPLVSWGLLSLVMSSDIALKGTMGSWLYVFDKEHSSLPFFKWSMGSESPGKQLWTVLQATLWQFGALLPWVYLVTTWSKGLSQRALGIGSVVIFIIILICFEGLAPLKTPLNWYQSGIEWSETALPWAIFCLAVLFAIGVYIRRSASNAAQRDTLLRAFVYGSFALFLLLKMILNVRIWHYGFALALPACLVVTTCLLEGLPAALKQAGNKRVVLQVIVLIFWVGVVWGNLRVSLRYYDAKQFEVASGVDLFYSDKRGQTTNTTLQFFEEYSNASDTMTAMPDGEMLPYLTRLENPIRYANFIPATMLLFGEDTMTDALHSSPPTWIALVHRQTSEYGATYFGKDYAHGMFDWIQQNYKPAFRAGSAPFNPEGEFGILIVRHRDAGPLQQNKIVQEE